MSDLPQRYQPAGGGDATGEPLDGIGARLPRREDEALLRGTARFFDERRVYGALHAVFVRAPWAHATIGGIGVGAAQAVEGVVAVVTGVGLREWGGTLMPSIGYPTRLDGKRAAGPDWPALATDRVRHTGEAVAMVLAEDEAVAQLACEQVEVEYDPLPAAHDVESATGPDAPGVGGPHGNIAHCWEWGDREATGAAFAEAAHCVSLAVTNSRVLMAAMEPRGVLAVPEGDRLTVYVPTQGVQGVRGALARALGWDVQRIRVVSDAVGGGFGLKNDLYPEYLAVVLAALRLGRPVRWYSSRSEAFVSDFQGRDHQMEGELALDGAGRMLAIRARVRANVGAYLTRSGSIIPTAGGGRMMTHLYRIPHFHLYSECVLTHTIPINAYRGAGKPEYCDLIERLVDEAARRLGLSPVELRMRNLIRPHDQPWQAPTGMVLDSGDYPAMLQRALVRADHDGFAVRRAQALAAGRLRGIGFAVFSEPDGFLDNRVTLRLQPDGAVEMTSTAVSNGQGQETTLAQVAASRLAMKSERIRVVLGDSDRVGPGEGTAGSRTATVSGSAIWHAGEQLIGRARLQAAHLLGVDAEQVVFADGVFAARPGNESVDWDQIARAVHDPAALAPGAEAGLFAAYHYQARAYNFPTGTHVAEIEIDLETGAFRLVRYGMVGDFGTVINPALLEGQLHGGVAQGIGQAFHERCIYEPGTGQLLTGSFMDYAIPRADDLPAFEHETVCTETLTNPLGVKGVGESGCTASVPAVMNALAQALHSVSAPMVQMPVRSEDVWQALRHARLDTPFTG